MQAERPRVYAASVDEIKSGEATDIYFMRTKRILREAGLGDLRVRLELHSYSMPQGYEWAVYAGLEEALAILEGRKVDVYSAPEGTVFYRKEPLMILEGVYEDFAELETAVLGVLRFSSTLATAAARMKKLAGGKPVIFFGLRVLHPAVYPAADRAAYIGGADAVSGILAEKYLGLKPTGTMPHALIISIGDQRKAWRWFADLFEKETNVIALADTFNDERVEVEMALEELGERLWGVRLDTPSSRRGRMRDIVEEIKWMLRMKGRPDVKVIVSGGIGEKQIVELRDVADGFGVGTSIVSAPSVDLSMDIVEVYRDGKWVKISKRGKLPGAKQLYRCGEKRVVTLWEEPPVCDSPPEPLLVKYVENGRLVRDLPTPQEIRGYVLKQLEQVSVEPA